MPPAAHLSKYRNHRIIESLLLEFKYLLNIVKPDFQ